jgi:hypothetical protein
LIFPFDSLREIGYTIIPPGGVIYFTAWFWGCWVLEKSDEIRENAVFSVFSIFPAKTPYQILRFLASRGGDHLWILGVKLKTLKMTILTLKSDFLTLILDPVFDQFWGLLGGSGKNNSSDWLEGPSLVLIIRPTYTTRGFKRVSPIQTCEKAGSSQILCGKRYFKISFGFEGTLKNRCQ